jgi:hypothetical protein
LLLAYDNSNISSTADAIAAFMIMMITTSRQFST